MSLLSGTRPNKQHRNNPAVPPRAKRRWRPTRRGVVGILAMMFLVLFTSLSLAMAVATQGNLRTASSHLRVTRALGAADTGIGLAASRLNEACARFVTTKGEMTPAYLLSLWRDATSATPAATVLPAVDGRSETSSPKGIAAALVNLNKADSSSNIVSATGTNAAGPITVPTPPTDWVAFSPIGIEKNVAGKIVTAVQISYSPPDSTTGQVQAIVTGYDWDYTRARWVTRQAQQNFSLKKTVRHAILSPSRVMIGRDVQVDGPVGDTYASHALDTSDGPPIVIKSDFLGLDSVLDQKIKDFYAQVLISDVDGDNRLRVGHPTEGAALATLNAKDYNSDHQPDNAFKDVTRDGYVDDYDIFLNHYDPSGNGRVVLSNTLTAGTTNANKTPMFTADDALAMLIDGGNPDRNKNGKKNGRLVNGNWDFSTFKDNNGDGIIDSHDIDTDDITLGYRDGVLDYKDQYAKIRGSVALAAKRSDWENSKDDYGVKIGNYQKLVQGPIVPDRWNVPVEFQAPSNDLPDISDSSFATEGSDLQAITDGQGQTFAQQVAAQKGANWTPPTQTESVPYGSPAPADWYKRPVYDGLTFKDVTIPMGNNGLFKNCTFIGVTRVCTYTNDTHASWAFYGQQSRDAATGVLKQLYPPPPATSAAQLDKRAGDRNYQSGSGRRKAGAVQADGQVTPTFRLSSVPILA